MKPLLPFISRESSDLQAQWCSALEKALPNWHVLPASAIPNEYKDNIEFAIVANPEPSVLAQFPALKWVHSVWAGVERLVAELPEDSPIEIVRLVDDQLADTMAEAILTWTLFLHRDIPQYQQQQKQHQWKQLDWHKASERTVGILGLGELGSAAAKRLQSNGFHVSGWSRQAKTIDNIICLHGDAGLDHLLNHSDILVCLLPLTPDTKYLLNQERLAQLPLGASIINAARGAIIDHDALLTAVDTGKIKHAVLDVFEQEPLPENSRFWQHPAISVFPHIAAPTCMNSASTIVANNVLSYVETGILPETVCRNKGY